MIETLHFSLNDRSAFSISYPLAREISLSILPVAPLLFVILIYMNNYRITSGVLFFLGVIFVASFTIFYGARDLYSGTDSFRYALAFEDHYDSTHWEVGYQLWMNFLRAISSSYTFFFLFNAFFCFFLFLMSSVSASRQYGKDIALLLFILLSYSGVVFDLTTNGMRQGLALSFAVLSVPMICSRTPIMGLILLLVASLVHNSFWILFLYAGGWISFPCLRFPAFLLLLATSMLFVVLVLLGVDIFSLLLKSISLNWIPGNLYEKILTYSELSVGSFGELNVFGKLNVILYALIIMCFGFFVISGKRRATDYTLFVASGGIFCLSIYFLMAYQSFSYRYLYFCAVFFPFIVCEWFFILKCKFRFLSVSLYCFSVILLSLISFGYFVVGSSSYDGFNYFI